MQDRWRPDRGHLLRRRDFVRALGAAGVGAVAIAAPPLRGLVGRAFGGTGAWAQATCTQSPELDEGPYYIDGAKLRRNVVEGLPGLTLWLSLTVLDAQTCAPVPAAVVDIWHAAASGAYSGFNGEQSESFMRGRQIAGDAGTASFRTIYPGWYSGRTPHIHVKVHVGGAVVHTGQLFFDEAVTSAVYAQEPYAARGAADTSNAADGIFARGGSASTLTLSPRGKGYWGTIALAVAT